MPPPPRILIVEDEPLLAENLRQYLSRRAPEVRTAGDGEHAIAMLASFTPDALIMDYSLPGLNGLQTYAEIVRRHTKKIDCVMITGEACAELALIAKDNGISDFLPKPFSFAELLHVLEGYAARAANDAPAPAEETPAEEI